MTDTDRNRPTIALEARDDVEGRMFSPSVARNREPILNAFASMMPLKGRFAELAAGTGEHVVALAATTPEAQWFPGDRDEGSRISIAAWTAFAGLANVAPPHALDATGDAWRSGEPGPAPLDAPLDGVVCINMVHIAPFSAAEGLIAGAGKRLRVGGKLFLYGPFKRGGEHMSSSNAAFDESLRSRNPLWGVRDLDRDLSPIARTAGLALAEVRALPANNLAVAFERRIAA